MVGHLILQTQGFTWLSLIPLQWKYKTTYLWQEDSSGTYSPLMFKIHMQKKYTSVGLNQVRAHMYLKTDYCIVLYQK